ncbi:hypothetical protein A8B79_12895 [Balneola sp. EhC07]|uniref:hypothetical protein n=1 Tax=Balneola sp. EhC07 TaxID=1849360 RepID=UPI0007F4B520|nr:hypothetical protein [Balneola sp. EhC07]OAN64238.1 hypothetical protein A8B79_12895 [Balneola sp. EhC07]
MKYVWITIGILLCLASGCKKGTPSSPDEPTPNMPATLNIEVPNSFVTDSLYTYTLRIEDEDGIDSIWFDLDAQAEDSRVFSNFAIKLPGESINWDTSLTVEFYQPATAEFTLSVKDRAEEPKIEEKNQSVAVQLSPNQTTRFSSNFEPGRVNSPLSWTWKASDKQGILDAIAGYVYEGETDTAFVELTVGDTEAETTQEITFPKSGTVQAFLRVTDSRDEVTQQTQQITILAELLPRQTTIDIGKPDVSMEVHRNELIASGTTNSEGIFEFTEELPKDSLVNYSITADALGLTGSEFELTSTADQTIQQNIEAVPITISNTLPGQYPRTTDTQDLALLVSVQDTEGSVPVTINLVYNGNNFDIDQATGTNWDFSTSAQDPAGVTEDFTLEVEALYSDKSQTVTKEIFDRRALDYLQTNFNVVERESLQIDLAEVLSSEAEITQASISDVANGLDVSNNGLVYTLTPIENISADKTYAFSVDAENADGTSESRQVHLTSEALPEFSATVVDHVNEQAVSKAYVVIEREDKSVIDSLVVNGGAFSSIEIPSNAESFRFGELRNERPYALEHRVFVQGGENLTIPVGNRDSFDKFKNSNGTHTEDELMRRWADSEIICGHGGLAGLNNNPDLHYNLEDELCGWAPENNYLPTKIVVAKHITQRVYAFIDGKHSFIVREDSMSDITLNIIIDNFDNEYRIALPDLPVLTIVDSLYYDYEDQEEDAMYIVPYSKPNDSRGTVEFYGTKGVDTGIIKHGRVTLRSNSSQDASPESQNKTQDQEFGALLFEQGRSQAQNLGNYESIVKQGHPNNNAFVFPLNLWMGWMATSDLYKDAPNKNMFTNASIIPKAWNPDYTSLTTSCDILPGDCSDKGY